MGRIDESIAFQPVRIAIVTISDTRDASDDKSGDTLAERVEGAGHTIAARTIIRDDRGLISGQFRQWADDPAIDVIISTGGTGVTGRDVTPEALGDVAEKIIDGFGELFRWLSYAKIGTSTVQSRAVAGVLNGTYIFCAPGSPSACRDVWDGILREQLDIRHRPCNFVELLPRLGER